MKNLLAFSHLSLFSIFQFAVLVACDASTSAFTAKNSYPVGAPSSTPTVEPMASAAPHIENQGDSTEVGAKEGMTPEPTVNISVTSLTPSPTPMPTIAVTSSVTAMPTVAVTAKEIGKNSTFIGFGASTGAFTNEHWLHDFSWTSRLDDIKYGDFLQNLHFVGTTTKIGESLRFTTADTVQSGNAFYQKPVAFVNEGHELIDWSASFLFSMGGGTRADGISFILQSNSVNSGGAGGGMAYEGIPKSIAISYDTYQNVFDRDNNHIEINMNGNISSSVAMSPFNILQLCGSSGRDALRYNWVDYTSGVLKIYISEFNAKPAWPVLSFPIDLRNYLAFP